ncbi:MAG: zinc ribbon domain-containing protein [Clostridia bacterium]
MAQICKNCGSRNSFGSRYCEECGQKLAAKINLSFLKKPFVKKESKIATAVVVIILIAVVLAITSGSGNVENTLDMYFRGVQKNDIGSFLDAFPKQAIVNFTGWGAVASLDYEDFITEFNRVYNSMDQRYGERFRIRYSILVKEYWKNDEDVKDVKQNLYDIWGIPKISVKEVMTLNILVTVRGNGLIDETEVELDMIKINNKWYIRPDNDAFMSPIG